MEGGQKIPINLEAGLDVSSSDMLVHFNQQTLQHNWQKWQGKCLPNSMRFEMDGWAAGWNVYNFTYNPFVAGFNDKVIGAEKLDATVYMLTLYDKEDAEFLYPLKDWRAVTESKILSGAAVISPLTNAWLDAQNPGHGDPSLYDKISVTFDNGAVCDLLWSQADKELSVAQAGNFNVNFKIKHGVTYVEVKDLSRYCSDELEILLPECLHTTSASRCLPEHAYTSYKYDPDGVPSKTHDWSGYTLKLENGQWSIVTPEYMTIAINEVSSLDNNPSNYIFGNQLCFSYAFDIIGVESTDRNNDGLPVYTYIGQGQNARPIEEGMTVVYSCEKYYKAFRNLYITDMSNEKGSTMLSASANKAKSFNSIDFEIKGSNKTLVPDGSPVYIDITVPVWWYTGFVPRETTQDDKDYFVGYYEGSDEYGHSYIFLDGPQGAGLDGYLSKQGFYRDDSSSWVAGFAASVQVPNQYSAVYSYSYSETETSAKLLKAVPATFNNTAVVSTLSTSIPSIETWTATLAGIGDGSLAPGNSCLAVNVPTSEVLFVGGLLVPISVDDVYSLQRFADDTGTADIPVIGVAFKGHMLLKLQYKGGIKTETDFANNKNWREIISCEPVTDSSEIADVYGSGYADLIFVNSDSISRFSRNLFTTRVGSLSVDSGQDDGSLSLQIIPNNNKIYYGVNNDDNTDNAQNDSTTKSYLYYLPPDSISLFEKAGIGQFVNFIQGITTGYDVTSLRSHMDSVSSVSVKVHWVPDADIGPTSVSATLAIKNAYNTRHRLYTEDLVKLQAAECSKPTYANGSITFDIKLNNLDRDGSLLAYNDLLTNNQANAKKDTARTIIHARYNCNTEATNCTGVTLCWYDYNGGGYAHQQPSSGDRYLFKDRFGSYVKLKSNAKAIIGSRQHGAVIPFDIHLVFDSLTARFAKVLTPGVLLNECSNGDIYKLQVGMNRSGKVETNNANIVRIYDLNYSTERGRFLNSEASADSVVTDLGNEFLQTVKFSIAYTERFSCSLKGVYDGGLVGGADITVLDDNQASYDVALEDLTSHNFDIQVSSTDVRDPKHVKKLDSLSPDKQLQLLRQQWNTTSDVENFWWVDRTHILELNKTHFVYKRKSTSLHDVSDWDGDTWIEVWRKPRHEILVGNVDRYFVSSVYEQGTAKFWTVEPALNEIKLRVFDIQDSMLDYNRSFVITLVPKHVELGHALNFDLFNNGQAEVRLPSYSQLTANMIVSKASWSSTLINGKLIIGCVVSNNLNQWTIVIDTVSRRANDIIIGYGNVGLHGELTGGMLPSKYFDVNHNGFTGVVEPLSTLDVDAVMPEFGESIVDVDAKHRVTSKYQINKLVSKIVGTAEQQWYIDNKLHGIVSHLEYVQGAGNERVYEKREIPLTNNFAANYASPSFSSAVAGDCMMQVSPLADYVNFPAGLGTVWKFLCGFVGYPLLYFFAPRFSSLCYLQQSFGQYAYVHKNSSMSPKSKSPEERETISNKLGNESQKEVYPVLSSEFIFDKQKVVQTGSTKVDMFAVGPIALLISAFGEGVRAVAEHISVNDGINLSTIKDTGRQFLENVTENVGDMLASSITSKSKTDIGLTSIVTGLKSLDMFYSTADGQRVFAGPGFTEMQFVANCVAQSVTDVQVEGKTTQLFLCLKVLTTLQMGLTLAIEDLIAASIEGVADKLKEMSVMTNNVGAGPAAALSAAATAIKLASGVQRFGVAQVEKMLDVICAQGATSNVDGAISRHALSVEGKHKYGEKNESFMWPCWGVPVGQLKYSDETVVAGVKNTPWELSLRSSKYYTNQDTNWANKILSCNVPDLSSNKASISNMFKVGSGGEYNSAKKGESSVGEDNYRAYRHEGKVPFYQIAPYGEVTLRNLPDDMAKIEGVSRFLPNTTFKNENISVSDPAFAPSLIHDYIIDKDWQLGLCATYGLVQWVTLRDTKVINGAPSNIIIDGEFCGIASPYTAIEVKRGIKKAYMRPLAITPNALALNCTGYNAIYDDQLYHAFDGMSLRLVDLVGSPGLNKNKQSFYYAIQVNDRFKRSNIIPAQELQGNFETEPTLAMETIDKLWTTLTVASEGKGLEAGTVGEDKDAVRWSVPVFTEPVSTLPACVKTLTAATLAVVEGVTGLVTKQVTDTNSAYKAPTSVDFTIGKNVYRATEEYICSVTPAEGGNIITDLIPSLGLKFIGSTPTEAYFYSKATRCYYLFTGSTLAKIDMLERFRDIQRGYWDFVNQEVVMPCLMTFKRLNPDVEDTDTETDNVIVPVLSKGIVSGELPPPLTTIFNDRSWYKCLSLPSGFAYQGPNRVIINRAVFTEYMLETMKENLGRWGKVPRERYSFNRKYDEKYSSVINSVFTDTDSRKRGVNGWTHNPFLLVTSALGVSENTDCMFEWEVTFCWPVEMDLLYGPDNYACVNIMGETMTPGGKRESRPTHVFLTKELFTRDGSYGYYSFRYQSKNGTGNRERLKIWSDAYIAVSSVTCECKVITQRRTEQLTQQIDVRDMKEL